MTVLVVSPRYAPDPGGIERLLEHLLPALGERGYEFVVATGTDDGEPRAELIDGIPVYRFPFAQIVQSGHPGSILRLASRLRDVEEAHGIDARHVHGFGDIGAWFLLRIHQRRPRPLAVSVHGAMDGAGPIGRTGQRLLRSADVVSVVSDGVRRSVAARAPEIRDDLWTIPNALPGSGPTPRPWRRGPLLAVGRLEDQKGFDVAIAALAHLSPRSRDVRLRIVGSGSRRDELEVQVRRLSLSGRVDLVGRLPAAGVVAALDEASIVLVPSRTMEGFSLVALEAARRARPVIASRVGGLPETVEDGVTGVLVPPGDPEALAAAIEALLGDPATAAALGKAARTRAGARFDFAACVSAYDDLYDELYGRTRPRTRAEARHG